MVKIQDTGAINGKNTVEISSTVKSTVEISSS